MEYPRDDNQVLSSSNIETNISTLKQIVSIFNDSIALRSIGNERAEKMVSVTKSYICILVWLYENQYSYGSSAKFINSDMQSHYVLNKIVLDNYNNRKMVLKDLPSGWNSVLSVLNIMKVSSKDDCDKILAIQSGISQLTIALHIYLIYKQKKKQMDDFNNKYICPIYKEDRYSEMVRTANFNPFKLTVNPLLNTGLQFGNMISIFKNELCSTIPLMVGNGYSAKEAIEAYTFNMIESYYNNAGYVPKAMSDAIFEQIYDAAKQTIYANHIGSIDDFKYKMYWTFTHQ